jgi:pyocin large subunit-like protein
MATELQSCTLALSHKSGKSAPKTSSTSSSTMAPMIQLVGNQPVIAKNNYFTSRSIHRLLKNRQSLWVQKDLQSRK